MARAPDSILNDDIPINRIRWVLPRRYLIPKAANRDDFHTVRSRICHLPASDNHQQVRFTKLNLVAFLIVLPYKIL